MKTAEEILDKHTINRFDEVDSKTFLNAMYEYANQQTKESLSTIRSLALQLDRKGVKTLIDEIDKMIGEL